MVPCVFYSVGNMTDTFLCQSRRKWRMIVNISSNVCVHASHDQCDPLAFLAPVMGWLLPPRSVESTTSLSPGLWSTIKACKKCNPLIYLGRRGEETLGTWETISSIEPCMSNCDGISLLGTARAYMALSYSSGGECSQVDLIKKSPMSKSFGSNCRWQVTYLVQMTK